MNSTILSSASTQNTDKETTDEMLFIGLIYIMYYYFLKPLSQHAISKETDNHDIP